MSKSPKYSAVANGDLRRRRLEQERQARERRRREAEARRTKERLERVRRQVRSSWTLVCTRSEQIATTPGARRTEVESFRAKLRAIGALIDSTSNEKALSRLMSEIDGVETELAKMALAIRERAAQDVRARIQLLGMSVKSIAERERFDPVGAREVDDLLARLEKASRESDAGQLAGLDLGNARSRVAVHGDAVAEARARHRENLDRATTFVGEMDARIEALSEDAASAEVDFEDLTRAADAVAVLRNHLADDQPLAVLEVAERLTERIDRVEQELDVAVDRLVARREMLSTVVSALPALGYTIDSATWRQDADGSVGLRAHRLSGEPLTVVVQDGDDEPHRINYLTETFFGSRDGTIDTSSCVSLESLASTLNAELAGDGFEPGRVTWDDDSGHRPPPAARASSSGRQTRSRINPYGAP